MIFPYLPNRVIRQFGRIQYVPDPPPSSVTCRECDRRFAHWNDHICHLSEEAAFPFQTTGEYTPWYIKVSHPYMVPDEYKGDRFAFLENQFAELALYSGIAVDPTTDGSPPPGSPMWDVVHNMHTIIEGAVHGRGRKIRGRDSGAGPSNSGR
ncbi:uncharacterized protein LOC130721910 [Lotus japonicus]|uniref:uncharacterized protein LOC130721910 n=1 Tax=Lotus japonicus TaxID=34305 RepID=UPI00258B87E0|nr:uncharacterized protein LOC130721910 [Lotus japonicus]